MTYDQWITEQAAAIEEPLQYAARSGHTDIALYVIPTDGKAWGRIVAGSECPEGATDVLAFPQYGTRALGVPLSQRRAALWDACRRMPICGA